jgi:GNAT superfamily N-acetyltransferase
VLNAMFRTMRAFWLASAVASRGGSALELPGVAAAIAPAMPERSVVNCVVYEEADSLAAALGELAAAYDDAGVTAWTVWVHESDADAQRLLAAAGHVLDGEPMAQVRELDGLEPPDESELDLVHDPAPADFDPIVAGAYGWPGFGDAMTALPFHPYVARHEGRPAACLGIFDHEGDAGVELVGTIPEARGRGLASLLMRKALADARDRGCTLTTLQATRMGHPVYSRLGYRDLGRVQMWERRRGAPGA